MNTVVIYQSSTGFTKQYAQWIAEELGCKAMDMKSVSGDVVKRYDRVIYGGWIMGDSIVGLDKIRPMNPKNFVVFSVGSTPDYEEVCSAIRTQNQLENSPFFYFEGGLHWDKLNFAIKGMLKMMKKSVVKKEDKTRKEEVMAQRLGTNFDHASKENIQPLLEYIREN